MQVASSRVDKRCTASTLLPEVASGGISPPPAYCRQYSGASTGPNSCRAVLAVTQLQLKHQAGFRQAGQSAEPAMLRQHISAGNATLQALEHR